MNKSGHFTDNAPIESFWDILKNECLYNPPEKERFIEKVSSNKSDKIIHRILQ